MRCHFIVAASFVAVFGSTPAALANGAVSEFPAGGVVFKSEKHISIASEELEIGWEAIRVRYVFVSYATETLERTIGFPMAKVSLADGPDNVVSRSWTEDANDDPRNYMAFKVSVNGKPVKPELHEYAWSGHANVTEKLTGMGIPLFAADPDAFTRLAQLPEATILTLRREDLVQEDEPDNWLVPKWEYQSVYEWTQSFAPGKTVVEISYKPLFGAGNDYSWYYEGGGGAASYCLGTEMRQKLAGLGTKGISPEPFTVGYILKTARNWNGPIGDFRLKISDGHGSLFSFCVPDGLQAAGDGTSWTAQDFVPDTDLSIVFYLQDY